MAPGECPGLYFLPGPPFIRAEMLRTEGRSCHHEDPSAIDRFVPTDRWLSVRQKNNLNRFNQNATSICPVRLSKAKHSIHVSRKSFAA